MTCKNLKCIIPVVALLGGNHHIRAQEFGAEYHTEWQTNFSGGFNWVNMLNLTASVPVVKMLSLECSTISVAKTSGEPLVDDLQGFSNIEEENLPLAFAVLGAQLEVSRSTIFLGIRNVNEDYFTSPVTSFFINSSCGIFPTISANFDIANYPLSSLCVHYKIDLDKFVLQTSLLDGKGHRRIAGSDNIFSFSPSKDGIFSITSAEYINNGCNYNLGFALHYGHDTVNADGSETEATPQASQEPKKLAFSPWVNIEQRLSSKWDLLLQGSVSTSDAACRYYFGAGATFKAKTLTMGLFCDYARYVDAYETATELSCKVPLSKKIYIQPTFEFIVTDSKINTVGLMRLSVNL